MGCVNPRGQVQAAIKKRKFENNFTLQILFWQLIVFLSYSLLGFVKCTNQNFNYTSRENYLQPYLLMSCTTVGWLQIWQRTAKKIPGRVQRTGVDKVENFPKI